jgi:anti-sigma regulatory factor (Ser/Thr protein kinase)
MRPAEFRRRPGSRHVHPGPDLGNSAGASRLPTRTGVPVELVIPPVPAELPAVRHAAEHVLEGVPDEDASDVLVALGEAVGNAIRHGSPAGAPIRVAVRVTGGWVEASVQDQGPTPWPPRLPADPPAPLSLGGRGLWMILQLVDEVHLAREGEGTVLNLRRRIRRRAS